LTALSGFDAGLRRSITKYRAETGICIAEIGLSSLAITNGARSTMLTDPVGRVRVEYGGYADGTD